MARPTKNRRRGVEVVVCPRCHAPVGEGCREPSGRPYRYNHKERMTAANRAAREGR